MTRSVSFLKRLSSMHTSTIAAGSKVLVTTHNRYDAPDTLTPSTVASSPLEQFRIWFAEAVKRGVVQEPESVSVSTATPNGIPSARMVLFKQLDERGFVFFTNYESRKSQELLANPWAAMVFYWREVHRSVRVLGKVEKVSEEDSREYFKSRPLDSKLGAWASRQSSVVGEGEVHERVKEMQILFKDGDVPLPAHWGGWRVVPTEVEFWAGRPSRLHDRIRYLLVDEEWKIDRLAP